MASHIVNAVRLVELRTRKGLSQSQLATLSQLSKPTIQRAESGDKLRPKAIQSIARALDVLPEELILAPSAGATDAAAVPAPMEALRRRFAEYLNELRTRFEPVQMIGLHAVTTGASYERDFRPKVADLFVEPYVLDQYTPPERSPSQWVDKPTAMSVYAQPGPKVLLGPPGSGKSMEVARIVLDLSQSHPTRLSRAFGDRIPIPLILRDLRVGIDTTLRSLVEEFHAQVARGLISLSDLWDCIETGRALILLDGLDEIPPEPRRAIRTAVWDGIEKYKGCEWLATSRVAGFEEVSFERDKPMFIITGHSGVGKTTLLSHFLKRSGDFRDAKAIRVEIPDTQEEVSSNFDLGVLESLFQPSDLPTYAPRMKAIYLAPFDNSQILEFIRKWYLCRQGPTRQAEEAVDRLWAAIQPIERNASDILTLARIPNLLTIMANLHIRLQVLPHGRSRLYREIAEAYIESIDRARSIKTDCRFDSGDQWLWLGRIAWELLKRRWLNRNQAGSDHTILQVSHTEALDWIGAEHHLGGNGELLPQEGEGFLRTIQLRSGLLIEREPGVYAFAHLTFAEYFAACYLTQNLSQWLRDERSDLWQLPEWSGSPLWHEMLVFAFEEITHLRKRDWGDLFQAVFPWFKDRSQLLFPSTNERLNDEAGSQQRLLLTRLCEDGMAGFEKMISREHNPVDQDETYRDAIRKNCREWARRSDPLDGGRILRENRFTDLWLAEIERYCGGRFAIDFWAESLQLDLRTGCSLNLRGFALGDSGVRAIGERLSQLTILDLGWNQVGELGARAIAERLTKLNTLDLRANHIGDAGSMAIAKGLTNLSTLYLWGNQISGAAQLELRSKLPNCTIYF